MDYLLILGMVQAIFFAMVLIFGRRTSLPNRILWVWMLILAVNLGGVLLAVSGFYKSNPGLFGYDTTLVFLHGPLLYLYVITSISKSPQLKPIHLIHFVPYLFFTGYLIYLLKVKNANADYEQIRNLMYQPGPVLFLLELSIHVLFVLYIIPSFLRLKQFQKEIPKNYSFTEGINFSWLQTVLFAFLFMSVLIVLSILLSDVLSVFSLEFKGLLFYGGLALLPFYLFFHAIHRKIIYPSDEAPLVKKYQNSTLSDSDVVAIQNKLQDLMKSEKPFLDGQLSISKLAGMLEVHQKQLSQVINEKYETNFFHFINAYRVVEVESKISNPAYKNFSLLGIAFDSGFNTKSAFSKAFKRVHGITPSQYKNQNQ